MAGRGFVKLYRDLLENPVFGHDGMFRLWTFCLIRANWQDVKMCVPGTLEQITVQRGQFITGRDSLHAQLYGLSYSGEFKPCPRTVWRWLLRLADHGRVRVQTVSNRCTLVTVCNYATYQDADGDACPEDVLPMSSRCPADVPPVSTNKEEQEHIKSKETKKVHAPKPPSPADESFDRFWGVFPSGRKTGRGQARKAWTTAIRKADPELIIAAAAEYASSDLGRSEYVKGPTPWLNAECWADDRKAWNRSSTAPARGPIQLPILEGRS